MELWKGNSLPQQHITEFWVAKETTQAGQGQKGMTQMVLAHQSHWLGEEGETQKQVTPGALFLSYLLLQSLNCSIIHLSPASASSGMVQNVSELSCLCSNDSQQPFQCLWMPFCWLERLTGYSSNSPQCDTTWSCEETCPRVHKGLMGLPRAGHKQRLASYTFHHPYPVQPPQLFPSPDKKYLSYFKKNFMCLLVCKLQSAYTFQMKWVGLDTS